MESKRRDKKDKRDNPLNLKKLNKIIEPRIEEILDLDVGRDFRPLINYQIETGGKRLRPSLAVLSCLACGGKTDSVIYPAVGLEILHNCTLIYDDIIDKGTLRRRKPTVWYKFGKSIAECVGITYAASVFQAASRSKKPAVISRILAKAMKEIVEGEILDILFEQSGRKDERYVVQNRYRKIAKKDYYNMIGKKTAFLLQACCEVGAVSAGAKKPRITALKKYGYNLGIAFQIRDDILDIFGEEKKSGKKIGKDIIEKKLGNIVTFYALKELGRTDRVAFLRIMKKKKVRDKDVKRAVELINKTTARERTNALGRKHAQKAKNNLKLLPSNEWRRLLEELADFVMKREK